jgi:uncharacterized protein YdhG (YjbR/CyaY superfamily)
MAAVVAAVGGLGMSAEEIEEYLEGVEQPGRDTLEALRTTILRLLPDAEQGLSYGVPAFRIDGKVVAGFSAAKVHLSYLPHSGSVLPTFDGEDLEGLEASKGALKFPVDTPPSDELVARLIAARRAELDL